MRAVIRGERVVLVLFMADTALAVAVGFRERSRERERGAVGIGHHRPPGFAVQFNCFSSFSVLH